MMKLTVAEILYYYDEPLLVEARDADNFPYMCLNCKDTSAGSWWLIAPMSDASYTDLVEKRRDLRSIFEQPNGPLLCAIIFGDSSEQFHPTPYEGQLSDDILPDPECYLIE